MPRLLLCASPVDHHNPADWYRYRDRIREALERAGAATSVIVDDDPLFSYGADVTSAIARVNRTRPSAGEVVIAQWSTIVFYSASVLFVGDGVDLRAVRSALSGEPFLKEHVGEYSLGSGSCYGYSLYPYADEDIPPTGRIVECVPDRVYVGAAWMVNDGEGAVDEERFAVLRRLRPVTRPARGEEFVVFRPRIGGIEEEIWRMGAQGGDGLIVMCANDPRLPPTLEAAELGNELSLFLGDDDGRTFPRATIGRCHMDDTLVCLYNHPFVTDEDLHFLV